MNNWMGNREFCAIARMTWPVTFALAWSAPQVKGRAEARREMRTIYKGFTVLPRMTQALTGALRELQKVAYL